MTGPVPPQLSVAELACEAAELIRSADLAAHEGGRPGLLHTAEAAETVAALAGLTGRLPELLDQLEAFLSSEQAAGRIGPGPADNREYDVIRAARDAREQLYEASRTAVLLSATMAAAAASLAPFGAARTAGGPTVPHI
ncbi:hypothetical protein KNE206_36560 [Kitasatospora sp. NE20-6]|uniref:hypothetical protein n=1 Tax=Kitasatospora sp. NE20-6 TaxID=2859066 RepID=UPI0034DC992B